MRFRVLVACLSVAIAGAACRSGSPPPDPVERYPLTGQLLALRPDIREVRLHHDEIPGYMPAMTMSLGVKDARELDDLERGDLVEATLVVSSTDAWLEGIRKVGHADVVRGEDTEGEDDVPLAPADLLAAGDAVPDATFVDETGRPWRPSDAAGRAMVLTFVDTRCPLPTSCPLITRYLREVQQMVGDRSDLRGRVQVVSVSFDPAFDTTEVLRQYAEANGADPEVWRFVTAERDAVERYAGRFGVAIVRNPLREADVRHTLRTAIVGPDGRIVRIYGGSEWTPAEVVATLAATVASQS
jgi:protein SCO1